jgi:hypothetical protein
MRLEYLSKTNVGPLYVTAANGWSALLVLGSDPSGTGLTITGARFEGYGKASPLGVRTHSIESRYLVLGVCTYRQNADTPSNGALVVQQGGKVIWRNIWVAYGMTNPSANGHSPVDQVRRLAPICQQCERRSLIDAHTSALHA